MDGWLVFAGSIILGNYLAGAYRLQHTFSRFNLVVNWLFSLTFALLVLGIISYAWFRILLGRGVLLVSVAGYSALSLFTKLLVYRDLFRSELFVCRTAVLGAGQCARDMRQAVERDFVLPAHRVVAFVRVVDSPPREPRGEGHLDGAPVLDAAPESLASFVRRLGVTLLIVAPDDSSQTHRLYAQLRRLRFSGVEVLTPLSVEELYCGRIPLQYVDEEFLMQASLESGLPVVQRLKRIIDIALGSVGAIIFLPVALLIAALIKLAAPRAPVLYSQTRTGQFGNTFRIHKFRTMLPDVERQTGPVWSPASDPRVTRLGRILRRFRLDEIPQIVNILRGEMSIVGPRPERPELIAKLAEKIPYFAERENVKPGLTGWAQIRHPYGGTVEDTARKLEYDLYYIKHLSLTLDLQIILSTLRIIMLGKERVL
jgi:exopolysaccharide biosynthesis polyprenyl glycosylphosphotransferase